MSSRTFSVTVAVALVVAVGLESVGCSATVEPGPAPGADAGASKADATAPSAARPADLDVACWKPEAVPCNPVSGGGCDAGKHCEYFSNTTDIVIRCVAPGAGGAEGAACDEADPGTCGAGLRCMAGKCATVCCGDSECKTGESCTAFEGPLGTLGACLAPPTSCAKPGRDCTKDADCCSGDCHGDHCH